MSIGHARTPLSWLPAEEIPDRFLASPFPPRADRGQIAPLSRSMRTFGCISPILARPRGERLQVVCGYRRLLAAQSAGLPAIPILVRDLTDEECWKLFTEENSHRESVREIPAVEDPQGTARALITARAPAHSLAPQSDRDLPPLLERACAAAIVDRATAHSIAERFISFDDQAAELRRIVQVRKEAVAVSPSMTEAEPVSTRARETPVAADLSRPPILRPRPATVLSQPTAELRAEPSADPAMAVLLKRTEAFFRMVAATRAISVEEAEAIAGDLIVFAPIRHGRDLRSFATVGSSDWLPAHSLLVTGLGIHFAESLGWTQGQVKKFALACLLHDVGMLFIPRQRLLSPHPLSKADRLVFEKHPAAGRELIQNTQAWGAQIHLVAHDHHERWDGSGYPGRKKGKEADLPARIVGFLDCFAALVTHRPHRPPILYSEALRHLAQETEQGRHDPLVLAHFRTIFTDLPVGAFLRLKDGRLGRVISADSRNPGRHRIRILTAGHASGVDEPLWIETAVPEVTEILPPYASVSPWSPELTMGGKPPAALAAAPRSSLS